MTSARSIGVRSVLWTLALGAFVHVGIADAQPIVSPTDRYGIGIAAAFPTSSPIGIAPVLLEVDGTPPHSAFTGDVELTGNRYSDVAITVRYHVRVPAGVRRDTIVPTVVEANGAARLTVPDLSSDPIGSVETNGGGYSNQATNIAVMGLGTRVVVPLTVVPDSEVHAGAGHTDPSTGEAMWPASPLEWGGMHVVVTGMGALLRAPPLARAALADFVLAGGILVLSPRTVADLRDRQITEMIGNVEQIEPSTGMRIDLRGERLARLPFGALASYGLGSVIVLRRDLSLSTWNTDPEAEIDLQSLVLYVAGRGGAYLPFGELSAWREIRTSYSSSSPRCARG